MMLNRFARETGRHSIDYNTHKFLIALIMSTVAGAQTELIGRLISIILVFAYFCRPHIARLIKFRDILPIKFKTRDSLLLILFIY